MPRIRWFSIIRTLGVVLVLIYHFFQRQSILPAGFLGVDVFFTFSGYLITMLIIEGFQKESRFRFFPYLRRRFLRIFPPLFFSVLLTLPFALLLSPDFTVGIKQQVIAVLSFSSNYLEILTGGSYEAQLLPHLYLHTWSLAVEMHFYLIWGVFFTLISLILSWLYRKSPKTGLRVIKGFVLVVALALAVLSFWYMQSVYAENTIDPSAAYFGTLTRGLPFMLGASAGVIIGIRPKEDVKHVKASVIIAICGMVLAIAGIVVFARVLDFSSEITYRWGFISVSLLTIVIIKCALVLHGASQKVPEPKVLAAVSNMSYSIYLFHWPLFIVFSHVFESILIAVAVTLALTLGFSYLVDYVLQPRITRIGSKKKVPVPDGQPIAMQVEQPITEQAEQPIAMQTEQPSVELSEEQGAVLAEQLSAYKAEEQTDKKERRRRPALRVLARTSVSWLLAVALLFSSMVLYRAPEVSSLEAEIYAGYLYQDVDEIRELERLTRAINSEPLALFTPLSLMEDPEQGMFFPNPGLLPNPAIIPVDPPPVVYFPPPPVIPPELLEEGVIGGVIVIGDSVCLGAYSALQGSIPDCYVNAQGSRNLTQGYYQLMQWQAEDRMREYVVVALGTNADGNYAASIEGIIAGVQPGTRLIFVTPYDGRWDSSWTSYQTMQYIRSLPSRYSFVTVADWAAVIEPNKHLLGGDSVHIGGNTTAINMYVNCIIGAINTASAKPAKA